MHQIFLPMSGTYILENMNTDQLAADKGYEFLFVLGVPKITGSVQAIINPWRSGKAASGTPAWRSVSGSPRRDMALRGGRGPW